MTTLVLSEPARFPIFQRIIAVFRRLATSKLAGIVTMVRTGRKHGRLTAVDGIRLDDDCLSYRPLFQAGYTLGGPLDPFSKGLRPHDIAGINVAILGSASHAFLRRDRI